MKRKIIRNILSVSIIVLTLYVLQLLLIPKYMNDVVEGALTAEYYHNEEGFDEKSHNVIFIGDCEVYENFSPLVLWEEYGIHSYIRGSAQQLVWQSYYILEDTLRYEKPDLVVFNVLALKYNESQKETYNRMTLEGLEWSKTKYDAINASIGEDESMIDYIFPILRYHSRWSSLSADDFKYIYQRDLVAHNGYYMRIDVKPVDTVPEGVVLADYQFGDYAYEYLDKMVDLCEREGIDLVLVKAPSLYPYWYEQWDEQMVKYANLHDLKYINYLELIDEVGIDFETDTYDAGLHLNLSGAEKLTSHFGQFLVDEFELEDRSGEEELKKLWSIKKERYELEIEEQKILYNIEN